MSKKTKVTLALLVCCCFAFSLLITGCQSAAEKAAEEAVEDAIKSESGEDVDVDIDSGGEEVSIKTSDGSLDMQTGKKMDWPDDMPDYVPQLDGDIIGVSKGSGATGFGYTVAYENIEMEMDSYVEDLEDNGWTVVLQSNMGDAWMVQAQNNEEEYLTASVNFEDNTGAVILASETN